MIVPMKKVYVVCAAEQAYLTLDRLHALGVLHLEPVTIPEGHELDEASHQVQRVQTILKVLKPDPDRAPSGKDGPSVVEAVWDLYQKRQQLDGELEALRAERERIAPFGDFDPKRIQQLSKRGIHVGLYCVESNTGLNVPDDLVRVALQRDKNRQYLGVFGSAPFELDIAPVQMPESSLSELDLTIARIEQQRAYVLDRFCSYAGDVERVRRMAVEAIDARNLIRARLGMGKRGALAYLAGYCPVDALSSVYELAGFHGWAVLDEEPSSLEAVPTLVRHPRWVKPIKLVLDFINITPGYEEVDISSAFLLFFSLFFAMIVGDAGYGLLFLILTLVGSRVFKQAPRSVFHLLTVMSLGTLAWGAITGTWFGLARLPAWLEAPVIPWLKDEKNLMLLCFFIGAVHLTLAHVWCLIQYVNRPRALAEVGWIATTWVMFFVARTMVLGFPFPFWGKGVFGAGVLLIVVFMTPFRQIKQEWFNHVMLPLTLIGSFVDVVSYVRLFAVGMATLAMAAAFNSIGAGMAEGGGVGGALAAALVIFVGHSLNILLASMGVLVHGIRLNTLEFSGHLGLQWKGIPYRPFSRTLQQKETT
ncbi:MAG: V/A-type H+-transporting ATPase subunit I [Kiritimatiellia bacterium]|jgi:V/A-type H+/Na+-transporting ATPase subunit I